MYECAMSWRTTQDFRSDEMRKFHENLKIEGWYKLVSCLSSINKNFPIALGNCNKSGNRTHTHNHAARNWTLNHLAKLAKN